jgi:hypothetical protein
VFGSSFHFFMRMCWNSYFITRWLRSETRSIFGSKKIKFEYSFEWIGWDIGENTRKIFCYTKYICVRLSIIDIKT